MLHFMLVSDGLGGIFILVKLCKMQCFSSTDTRSLNKVTQPSPLMCVTGISIHLHISNGKACKGVELRIVHF